MNSVRQSNGLLHILFIFTVVFLSISNVFAQSKRLLEKAISDLGKITIEKDKKAREYERKIAIQKVKIPKLRQQLDVLEKQKNKIRDEYAVGEHKLEFIEEEIHKGVQFNTHNLDRRMDALLKGLVDKQIEISNAEEEIARAMIPIDKDSEELKKLRDEISSAINISNNTREFIDSTRKNVERVIAKLENNKVIWMLLLQDFKMLGVSANMSKLEVDLLKNVLKQKIRDSFMGRYIQEWSAKLLQESCDNVQMCVKGSNIKDMNRKIKDSIKELNKSIIEQSTIIPDKTE